MRMKIGLWTVIGCAASVAWARPKAPAWLSGPDPKYPESKYMTGVGLSNDLDGARANARAEIARSMQARVRQTLIDQQSETSTSVGEKRGPSWGSQKSHLETDLSTDLLLEGVTIAETHYNKKTKTHYALAVLDKGAARKSLTERILDSESTLSQAKKRAEGAGTSLEKVRALGEALRAAHQRDELVARRRWVDPAGMAVLSGPSTSDLQTSLNQTLAALPVSIEVDAPTESALQPTVTSAVTGAGLVVNDSDPVLSIKAHLEVSPFDRGLPNWFFYRWSGAVELREAGKDTVLASAVKEGVESHLIESTAESKALSAGESALGQETARLLDSYLSGK